MGARELLLDLTAAGLSVSLDGGRVIVRPSSRLTDGLREAIRAEKPALVELLAESPFDLTPSAWTDADISAFLDRRARLLRWGWPEPEAEKLAERLVSRDRERDDRVICIDCSHFRRGRCGNHKAAGLDAADLGRDLARVC